jgi:hypothetical protein
MTPGFFSSMPCFSRLSFVTYIAFTILSCGPVLVRSCETPEARAARLSKQHSIRIEFGAPDTFFTPPYGPADAVRPWLQAEQADPRAAGVALEGVEAALQAYPPGFVDKMIDAIFICGYLRMSGVQAGGTAGPAWIILSAPSQESRSSIKLTAELGVHHELSSFVLRWNPQTIERWAAIGARAPDAVTDPGQALRKGDGVAPDPSTGFLTAYGATNPENDFNIYSEKIFTEPQSLGSIASTHAIIRRKLTFVLEAYLDAEPRLHAVFSRSGLPVQGQ